MTKKMTLLARVLVGAGGLLLVACQSPSTPSSQATPSASHQQEVDAIDAEKAKQVALAAVGVTEVDVTNLMVTEEMEDGRHVYEVAFTVDGKHYNVTVDHVTGSVVSVDSEVPEALVEAAVTEVRAKEIALTDAGLAETEVAYLKVSQDDEQGKVVYEVEFAYQGQEYSYVLDANSGHILAKEVETAD